MFTFAAQVVSCLYSEKCEVFEPDGCDQELWRCSELEIKVSIPKFC